jgi:molybdate transport system ATP-binding protein
VERLELAVTLGLRSFELDVELAVGRETVALVGPSGAGKTTVLGAVAGVRRPDCGRIALGDRVWFDSAAHVNLRPEARSVGLVPQEYALFPHLSVRANVAFGGRHRVDELLDRLGIAPLAGARPDSLSGGERQRVALARALARDPAVLLLDEPLSALDAHTRAQVREELRGLLRELALPTLLVTHDFGDAAALSDRIGVIVRGTLRQVGTVAELIADPADPFVVSLTGGNLLPGTARPLPGGGSEVALDTGTLVRSRAHADGRVGVAVYPWEVRVESATPAAGAAAEPRANTITAPITTLMPDAGRVRVCVGPLTALVGQDELDRAGLRHGDVAQASFSPDDARVLRLDEPADSAGPERRRRPAVAARDE